MAIIGVLLGFGVGAFDKLAAVDRVAAGQIRDALRTAKSLAVAPAPNRYGNSSR